jgi:Mn-dependent DtxR family transcriptional regulator
LGVDLNTAQQAACKIEHTLGPKIISRLTSFTDFIQLGNGQIAEKFKSDYNEHLNAN